MPPTKSLSLENVPLPGTVWPNHTSKPQSSLTLGEPQVSQSLAKHLLNSFHLLGPHHFHGELKCETYHIHPLWKVMFWTAMILLSTLQPLCAQPGGTTLLSQMIIHKTNMVSAIIMSLLLSLYFLLPITDSCTSSEDTMQIPREAYIPSVCSHNWEPRSCLEKLPTQLGLLREWMGWSLTQRLFKGMGWCPFLPHAHKPQPTQPLPYECRDPKLFRLDIAIRYVPWTYFCCWMLLYYGRETGRATAYILFSYVSLMQVYYINPTKIDRGCAEPKQVCWTRAL